METISNQISADLERIIAAFEKLPEDDLRRLTVMEIPSLFTRSLASGKWVARAKPDDAYALMTRLSACSFSNNSNPFANLCAHAGWILHAAFPRQGYIHDNGYEPDPRLDGEIEKAKGATPGNILAAAPELLEALKSLLPLAENGIPALLENSHPEERPGHHDGLLAVIDTARAAIAKAEGRQE